MIDIKREQVLTLSDAAQKLPSRRNGKRTHPASLYRWAATGLRGVKLEVIRVGGSLCTSVEALQRYFNRLTDETQNNECSKLNPMDLVRTDAAVERQLDDYGISEVENA